MFDIAKLISLAVLPPLISEKGLSVLVNQTNKTWHQWQLTLTLINNLELFHIPRGKFEKWLNATDE